MAAVNSKAFARAKSNKISVTETYTYRAEVSDNASMVLKEANGEIKVEFLYDGSLRDFRWKIRVAWEGLCDRWLPLKQIRRFFEWGPASWLTRWLGLQWFWRRFEKLLLGPQDDGKYFSIAAIADAEKYANSYQTAQVGHLILRGYRNSASRGAKREDKNLKLELPIDDIRQKLAQSRKYELCYEYPLPEPTSPPVRIEKVALTDEVARSNPRLWLKQMNSRFEELYSKYDEALQLGIVLEVDGGQPELDADGKVPRDLIERWWHRSRKIRCVQEEKQTSKQKNAEQQDKNNRDDELPFQEQISCLVGLCDANELASELNFLARRGGYLLVQLKNSDQVDSLRKRLLKTAFCCDPFVPIFEPYSYEISNKPVVVVPVPAVRDDRSGYRPSHLSIKSDLRYGIDSVDEFIRGDNTVELAKTLSAMANTAGGLIFLIPGTDNDRKRLGEILGEAINQCQPHIDWQNDTPIKLENEWKTGWIISIKRSSSKVYSVGGEVYRWEGNKNVSMSNEEIYELIRTRCAPDYPLIIPRPVISYAYINWPCFDARESQGVRYDPQKQIMKWTSMVLFGQPRSYEFQVRLPLELNRPTELYKASELTGEIRIEFEDRLFSELAVDYFNALGQRRPAPQGGYPIVEKKSKVVLELNITLPPLFRRREFITERTLEFEGVKPDVERLEDIRGMLASLGLENIKVESAADSQMSFFTNDYAQEILENEGYYITGRKPGLIWVKLHIWGEPLEIRRERLEGERLDEMPIQIGKTYITIEGIIRGETPQALLNLLNRLQRLLKERFNYLRFQVA